jgi:hypothetical protein
LPLVLVIFSLYGQPQTFLESPPLLSDAEAYTIRTDFEARVDSFCRLPGTIVNYSEDSVCFNPLQYYINSYYYDTAKIAFDDSLREWQVKIALYSYDKFTHFPVKHKSTFRFSHTRFLSFAVEKKEPREMPWILKKLEDIMLWLKKHIWDPLMKPLYKSFRRLSVGVKILVVIAGMILFLLLIALIARAVSRIYPAVDYSDKTVRKRKRAVVVTRRNRLEKAYALFTGGELQKALEQLYVWLLEYFTGRNGIKRYEWWTNRQFLDLVKKRRPEKHPLAQQLIQQYEETVYGHRTVGQQKMAALFKSIDPGREKR